MTMRTMTSPRIQSIAAMRVVFAVTSDAAGAAVVVTAEADWTAIECSSLMSFSVGLQAGGPEHLARFFRGLGARRLGLLEVVLDAELFPLEPAQLVKRQYLDALDVAEPRREL